MRGALALDKNGSAANVHDLDGFFGLNPAFTNLKAMYDAKEAVFFHNICSPYRDRSHFEGQNCLETGGNVPHVLKDGWLNRALAPMGLANGTGAVAIEQTPPLLLSGSARAASWMPAVMPEPDSAFLAKVRALYATDPMLAQSLDGALNMQAQAASMTDDPNAKSGKFKASYGNLTPLFEGAGQAARRTRTGRASRSWTRAAGTPMSRKARATACSRAGSNRSTRGWRRSRSRSVRPGRTPPW